MEFNGINFRSPSVLLGTVLAIIGIGVISLGFTNFAGLETKETVSEPVETVVQPEPVVYRATIAAVGDLLIHTPINNSVKDRETGEYDYREIFRQIKPYIQYADYSIANLETRMDPERRYSGYPRFNTPAEFADTIKWAGFDLVAMANNHSMDMGVSGIFRTLETLDAVGLPSVGNYSTPEARETIFIQDINGIKVAFLNYTEKTNGLPVPAESYFACNVLDVETVQMEAVRSRNAGADYVVALLHFGNEYQREPSSEQAEIVKQLCEGGVDFVIGSHPHVVQRFESFTVARGDLMSECYAAYSLGNFVSNQRDRYTDSGIILYLELVKDETGTRVDDIYFLPAYVQKSEAGSKWNYRILPVHPELEIKTDIELTVAENNRINEVWSEIHTHLVDGTGAIRSWDGKD